MKPTPKAPLPSTTHMVDYDQHSHMQDNAVLNHADRLRGLVRDMGPVEPEFVVMDLGCGPGRSALHAVEPTIAAYRELDPTGAIVVRHGDQPGNDWSGLISILHGPNGYQRGNSGIRTEFVIGSFYGQMASPGSVALATCFAASHWMSTAPRVHSPGTLLFADLEGEARQEFAAHARADWTQFLRQRAVELRPDGRLMVSTLGAVPDDTQPNGVRSAASKLYRAMFKVAEGMVADGLLQKETLDDFVFPLWFPTAAEIRQPVDEEADLADAFEVLDASVAPAAYHPLDLYEEHLGDPARYASLYATYVRGFGETSINMHLCRPSARDDDDATRLTDEFFRRYEALFRAKPGVYAFETLMVTLIVRKR